MNKQSTKIDKLVNEINTSGKYKEIIATLKMVKPKYNYMFANNDSLILCEHPLENWKEQCTMITNDNETDIVDMGRFLSFKYRDTTALFEKSGDSWGIRMIDGFFFDEVLFLD